jgi:hypothetical protein
MNQLDGSSTQGRLVRNKQKSAPPWVAFSWGIYLVLSHRFAGSFSEIVPENVSHRWRSCAIQPSKVVAADFFAAVHYR